MHQGRPSASSFNYRRSPKKSDDRRRWTRGPRGLVDTVMVGASTPGQLSGPQERGLARCGATRRSTRTRRDPPCCEHRAEAGRSYAERPAGGDLTEGAQRLPAVNDRVGYGGDAVPHRPPSMSAILVA